MKGFKSGPILLSAASVLLCGCSIFADKPHDAPEKPEIYRVASRQLPPEPVYNKVRAVHLPITYPEATGPEAGQLELKKNLKIGVKNMPLEAVVKGLADSSTYSSYTASTIAKNKITLTSYGNIDEIARDLAVVSKANVIVDHKNREIRVLEQQVNLDTEAKFASAQ